MKVLLNATEREVRKVSGDATFLRNLLSLDFEGVEWRLAPARTRPRRAVRKMYERAIRRGYPAPVRRSLLRQARLVHLDGRSQREADVVLTHIVFPRARRGDAALIWSSQGISPASYYQAASSFTQEDVVELYNDLGNRADLLLIWTDSGARQVRQLCSIETPIVVLPPILPLSPLGAAALRPADRDRPCRILFVGADARRKGLFELAETYNRLARAGANVTLDVVSRLTEDEARRIRRMPRATYHTAISDAEVSALMERSDVLALPTHAETYGFVLVEAMARGCALVAADYEPLNELARTGENGLTVPAGDTDALERALGALVDDPALLERLKTASRRRYEEEFSAERLVPAYRNMFERAIRDLSGRESARLPGSVARESSRAAARAPAGPASPADRMTE